MHIVIIPSWYPKNEEDIKVSFIREQAEALKDYDNSLKIGVINSIVDKNDKLKSNVISKKIEKGIIVYRNNCSSLFNRIPYIGLETWIKNSIKLFDEYINDNGKPDILHSHFMLYGGLLAHRISKKYGIKFIVTEHNSGYARGFVKNWELNFAKKAAKDSSDCIAVSEKFTNYLNKIYNLGEKKWKYIPNMVSKSFFNYPLIKYENKNAFTFTSICSLNSNKGVDILINAFYQAFYRKNNIYLLIGGDGPEKEKLINLVKSLKINKQIFFLGKLKRDEVLSTISKADSYVLSSHYETFGVVLAEALALGKPVVSTACTGPESIVTKGNGLLVEKNNITELSKGLLKIHNNYQSYNSLEIRNDCYNRFSQDVVVKKLINRYKKVLKG